MGKYNSKNALMNPAQSSKKYKVLKERRLPVKKVKGRPKKEQSIWAIKVTLISFFLSLSILFISTGLFEKVSVLLSLVVVLAIVFIGVMFDVIGVAVTVSDEKPFHAMASKKYKGAKQAIRLIRNADKVSSICNDVIGDICGVVSGSAGTAIVFHMFSGKAQSGWIEAIIGGLIAALTVGGKAFAKKYAMNNSNLIVYKVGSLLSIFTSENGNK